MSDVKLVYAPEVYLVAHMVVEWDMVRAFLSAHGFSGARLLDGAHREDADAVVEIAGRICYLSFDAGRNHEDYIRNILESQDGSVTHASVFGLIIAGVSRSFSFEWIRHKTGIRSDEVDGTEDTSISQLSQRYVDASDVRFVVPPDLARIGGMALELFIQACEGPQYHYAIIAEEMSKDPEIAALSGTDRRKRIRQAARSVLPNAAETMFYVTGNARAFRNLLEQRTSPLADMEFRRVAHEIGLKLRECAPQLFGDYEVSADGVWTTENGKV